MNDITKIDILAIGAHPDDQELSCGGTLLKHREMGFSIGLLDLTRGEMGTRGTPQIRRQEALDAADMLRADFRIGLDLEDGFLRSDREALLEVIEVLRACRPRVVLANAIQDRHTDHAKGAELVHQACFLSGLAKIETQYKGEIQNPYRPPQVYHYIQDRYVKPDFVVDIDDYLESKMELVLKYRSQFYQEGLEASTQTPISGKDFLEFLRGRAAEMGRAGGFTYGEGYTSVKTLGVKNLADLY